jgi:hypothetical protein
VSGLKVRAANVIVLGTENAIVRITELLFGGS